MRNAIIRIETAQGLIDGRPFGLVGVGEFGAVGDGIADDTAALQAAIDAAAGGGCVQGQPGATYGVTGSLSVPSGVTLQDLRLKRVSGVFDIIVNADAVAGNESITLRRIHIDGQRAKDSLTRTTPSHRFAGVRFRGVTNSAIEEVTVVNTVNGERQAEGDRAGIVLENCSHCDVLGAVGEGNDGTFLMFSNSTFCRAIRGRSVNDAGSGFTSTGADDCELSDWISINSGAGGDTAYSGISLNGLRMSANNLRASACTGAGVNIGHDGQDAAGTQVSLVHASNNQLEGLSIVGASDVAAGHVFVEGNGLKASRNNVRISGADRIHLSHLTSKSAVGTAIFIDSGSHVLEAVDVFDSGSIGINLESGAIAVMRGVRAFDNGKTTETVAGIVIKGSGSRLVDVQCFDNANAGLWLNGGGDHTFIACDFTGNSTYQVRESGSPTPSTWVSSLPVV